MVIVLAASIGTLLADHVIARGIAEWNGTSWAALGPPSSGVNIFAVAVGIDGTVFVGGCVPIECLWAVPYGPERDVYLYRTA